MVFAGDGSRIELPRTKSLEEAFSPQRKKNNKKKGKKRSSKARRAQVRRTAQRQQAKKQSAESLKKKAHSPQMWLTLLWHVGSGLPWAWKTGPSVSLWPDAVAKKKQPPLVLRLMVIHNGKHPVYLVTDLNKSQLSDRQAATIYGARWGIEVFFRTFKQTFGRRKLRSRSPENAKLELDWSLLGLWCVCLLGQRELVESGEDPLRSSPASVIRAFQSTLRDYRIRPESLEESLWSQLRLALLDNYQRRSSKTSRNYPRQKTRDRISAPKITDATKPQITAAKELKQQEQEVRLPA